ncbi:MAG: DUF433 domain-containing protein [Bacteroidota bacterium]|nr:DUF433 domain-containing protein [Flavisolibacter sp.]MBD0350050.1 DUF433 domain-containing protein [Flavisolibacter sp.]MBD0365445.1 DUF433 domain-containing protein [Flavisolibacter sp.]MBD0377898.1 DUF433 domain-containing protein [Flavisolibacter sp.]MDQ3846462.1 DUF433 domain-containing protein [Bacteroidota bacterium]
MENLLSRITIDPDICNGKPIIRGKRITAATILEFLSAGETQEEILKQYPSLEKEDIAACLLFASELLKHNYSVINYNDNKKDLVA